MPLDYGIRAYVRAAEIDHLAVVWLGDHGLDELANVRNNNNSSNKQHNREREERERETTRAHPRTIIPSSNAKIILHVSYEGDSSSTTEVSSVGYCCRCRGLLLLCMGYWCIICNLSYVTYIHTERKKAATNKRTLQQYCCCKSRPINLTYIKHRRK